MEMNIFKRAYARFARPLTIRKIAFYVLFAAGAVVGALLWDFGPTLSAKILSIPASRNLLIPIGVALFIWQVAATLIARFHAMLVVHQPWGFVLFGIALGLNGAVLLAVICVAEPAMAASMHGGTVQASLGIFLSFLKNWTPENLATFGGGHISFSAPAFEGVKFVPLQLLTRFPLLLIVFYVAVYARAVRRRWRSSTPQ